MGNVCEVDNNDTRTTSMSSFWWSYYQLLIDFTNSSGVPSVTLRK